jgi:hypothetical protein
VDLNRAGLNAALERDASSARWRDVDSGLTQLVIRR